MEKILFNLIALIFILAPIVASLIFSISWGSKKNIDKSLPSTPPEIKVYVPAKNNDYEIWKEKLSEIEKPYDYDNPADYLPISSSAVVDTSSSTTAISVRLIPPFN